MTEVLGTQGRGGSSLVGAMESKLAHEDGLRWAMASYGLGRLRGMVMQLATAVEALKGDVDDYVAEAEREMGFPLADVAFLQRLSQGVGEHDDESAAEGGEE
jgi:hypothetical protein